ncbi:hypothetical protein HK104_006382, partial [Borealophlyctis nickersoniae]
MKGSPWSDYMVGPLAKLMKVPDPTRKWIIREESTVSSPGQAGLLLTGPLPAVTVYEETLTIPIDS